MMNFIHRHLVDNTIHTISYGVAKTPSVQKYCISQLVETTPEHTVAIQQFPFHSQECNFLRYSM